MNAILEIKQSILKFVIKNTVIDAGAKESKPNMAGFFLCSLCWCVLVKRVIITPSLKGIGGYKV